MYRFNLGLYIFLSFLIVPSLTLYGPTWLSIYGVSPCWAVIWLLPWALKEGQLRSLIAGIVLGLILDSLGSGIGSQVPILTFLGYWWSRLGRRSSPIKKSFSLGLLVWIGTFLFGMSIWIQTIIFEKSAFSFAFWGGSTLLAQSFLTSLIAPLICSWLLFLWEPRSSI